MYKVEFSKKAEKQFDKLNLNVQGRILAVLERLKVRPHSRVKKIVGNHYLRARAGDYRIILDIVDKNLIIYVIEVGHRKNIYNNF